MALRRGLTFLTSAQHRQSPTLSLRCLASRKDIQTIQPAQKDKQKRRRPQKRPDVEDGMVFRKMKQGKSWSAFERDMEVVSEFVDDSGELDRELAGKISPGLERDPKVIKYKIIEKKYFRRPQETNVLTWEARERLRSLHRSDPEEWTVPELADKFCLNEDGVRNILKSTWAPKNVRKHDQKVVQTLREKGISREDLATFYSQLPHSEFDGLEERERKKNRSYGPGPFGRLLSGYLGSIERSDQASARDSVQLLKDNSAPSEDLNRAVSSSETSHHGGRRRTGDEREGRGRVHERREKVVWSGQAEAGLDGTYKLK